MANSPQQDGASFGSLSLPPSLRMNSQPMLAAAQASLMGLASMSGMRPVALTPAGGLPLFQAQASAQPSTGGRRSAGERSKSSGSSASRKQCNCKNSRCLKLYCECFASGRYCDNCNCLQCYNNRENEATRQSAVEAILERNPNAFRPKIQSHEQVPAAMVVSAAAPGRHLKGCNCKKSFCLKKYCECFQAGIFCSDNCKCVDCKNYEETGALGIGTGISGLVGNGGSASGASAKRTRYSSAPPPPGLQLLPTIRPPMLVGSASTALATAPNSSTSIPVVAPSGPGNSLAPFAPGDTMSGPSGFVCAQLAAIGGPSVQVGGAPGSGYSLAAVANHASGPGGIPRAAPPQPASSRSALHETVNGMVKRSVIEELCGLLWVVADEEGQRGGARDEGQPPGLDVGGGKSCQQDSVDRPTAEDGNINGDRARASEPAAAGPTADTEPAGSGRCLADGLGVAQLTSAAPYATGNGQWHEADCGTLGTAGDAGRPSEAPSASGRSTDAGPISALSSGVERLHMSKERVVLEEFLSIMNKISNTAAKRLASSSAACQGPSGQQHAVYLAVQQPHPGGQQQTHQAEQAVQPPQLPMVLAPGALQPLAPVVCPLPTSQQQGFTVGAVAPRLAGSNSDGQTSYGQPQPAGGDSGAEQVSYMNLLGIPLIRPPLPASNAGHSTSGGPPLVQYHQHIAVPVIPAPPRGHSMASADPLPAATAPTSIDAPAATSGDQASLPAQLLFVKQPQQSSADTAATAALLLSQLLGQGSAQAVGAQPGQPAQAAANPSADGQMYQDQQQQQQMLVYLQQQLYQAGTHALQMQAVGSSPGGDSGTAIGPAAADRLADRPPTNVGGGKGPDDNGS